MPELSDLELLESCVRVAGEIARKFYGTDFKRWSKAGGSPVTEADLAVDVPERKTSGGAAGLWLAVGGEPGQ